MNEQDFPYKGFSLVSFEDRYAIDNHLIGNRFPCCISESCWVEICFPLLKGDLKAGHTCPFLTSPFSFDEIGIDLDNWGKVNGHSVDSKGNKLCQVWINALGLFYHSNIPLTDDKECRSVESKTNKMLKGFLSALQVINPDALRFRTDEYHEPICEHFPVCPAVGNNDYQRTINIAAMVDNRTGIIHEKDIKTALDNSAKSLSVQYLLVTKANNDFRSNDYRGCVLNCASAIEVTIRRELERYLEDNHIPEELVVYIFGQANGYLKYIELLKKLKLPTSNNDQIKINVMDIRNRVIHGGFTPDFKAAENCLKISREFLRNQKVKMFE